MILTDYFRPTHDATWDFALASGVRHGVIRLPEDGKFDYGDGAHWQSLVKRFTDFGITPVAIEPMPNELHDHIKAGDELRDESTPLLTRVANFLDLDNGGQDPINSFLGGALVDTVLDNLPFVVNGSGVHVNNESLIPGYLNARQQRQGYRNIRDTGGRVFVPGEYGNMNLGMPGQTEE